LHLQAGARPRYVWIDALCIDQKNLAERSHHVVLMKDIYGIASEVIIWLRPDPDNQAEDIFMGIDNTFDEMLELIELEHELEDGNDSMHQLPADVRLSQMIPLLHREWFARTWTI